MSAGPAGRPVVWITGAGSGMGRAAAVAAAQAGWNVALSGRSRDALEDTSGRVGEFGVSAVVVPLDVRSGDVPAATAQVTQAWGRLDALVLSAGLNTPRRDWSHQSMADFDDIVQTNLLGTAHVIDAALPALREARGVVVVVSSYAGWAFAPAAGVAYSASKTALGSLVRTLNAQEATHGVRACHLCPGDVDTDFLRLRPTVPDASARAMMLSAEDIGRAIQFVIEAPQHVRVDELVISPVSQA